MTIRSPHPQAPRGLVATPHRLASEAGAAILAQGGNALDAALAAASTIAVVYPHMTGVGGDVFLLLFDATAGRVRALNAAGRSAAGATLEGYRARFGGAMPTRGGAAALTVPGTVSGWWEAHRYSRERMGSRIEWPALLADAIRHAREGFAVSAGQRRVTAAAVDLFGDGGLAARDGALWRTYHPARLDTGTLVQEALGRTLQELAAQGAETFYRGPLAGRLAAGAEQAGSPLTADDLGAHRAEWVEPITIAYRGGTAVSAPPPTQGFAALAILGLLEGFDLRALDEADVVHVIVEATKLAFEDRDRYLTDPTMAPVPVERCLDVAYLADRRQRIGRRQAMRVAGAPAKGDTVAIVAADAQGNAVSIIQSLYWEFGSGVVAGDTGVILQNRGAFFSLDAAHPNRLAPRKQTAHTLIPSMYLVDGRPRLVYGTMGGEGQPQTQAALLTRVLDRGFEPHAAVEAPRWLFGRTWGARSTALHIEDRFGADVAESLRRRGHEVRIVDGFSDLMGHAQLIRLHARGLDGGSDPRADGVVAGA